MSSSTVVRKRALRLNGIDDLDVEKSGSSESDESENFWQLAAEDMNAARRKGKSSAAAIKFANAAAKKRRKVAFLEDGALLQNKNSFAASSTTFAADSLGTDSKLIVIHILYVTYLISFFVCSFLNRTQSSTPARPKASITCTSFIRKENRR